MAAGFGALKMVAFALISLNLAAFLLSVTANMEDSPYYNAWDDASWAVKSNNVSSQLGDISSRYKKFIEDCNLAVGSFAKQCERDDEYRLRMNRDQPSSVYNYTKVGFKKIKAPKELYDMIYDFYTKNKDNAETEWKQINTYHNMWESPPTIVHLNQPAHGGSSHLQARIWDMARDILEEWTGQMLSPVSLYGVRVYHNNSILTPHVDRMPLVTSAISKSEILIDFPLIYAPISQAEISQL